MNKAKVTWFDQLKGLGEAQTNHNETIFLNAKNIIPVSEMFTGLQKNQNIEVDTNNQIHRLVKCSDCDATKWADATGTQCFMCWSEGFGD